VKFWMNSVLMIDCADRAVSDPCDGELCAAGGSAADTVTASLTPATASETETLSVFPVTSWTIVRRFCTKPDAATSTTYSPAGTASEKWPMVSVAIALTNPVASLRTTTAALGTALPSGSSTMPVSVAEPACANTGVEEAGNSNTTDRARSQPPNLRPKYTIIDLIRWKAAKHEDDNGRL